MNALSSQVLFFKSQKEAGNFIWTDKKPGI